MHAKTTAVATLIVGLVATTCSNSDTTTPATPTVATAGTVAPSEPDRTVNETGTNETDAVSTAVESADSAVPVESTDDGIAPPQTPLGEVVITADDLPASWSQIGFEEGETDVGADDTAICGLQEGALSQLNGRAGGQSASSQFQQTERGPFLTTFAVDPADGVDVRAAFDAFVDAASSCTEFTVADDNGGTAIYQIEPAPIGTVGDDVFAATMTVTAGPQTVFLLIAVSLSNDVLLGASEVDFAAPPDADFVGYLLEAMSSRL